MENAASAVPPVVTPAIQEPDYGSVVAIRVDPDITDMLDDARVKLSKNGVGLSRSAVVKGAVYWYLSYLGYKPSRPEVGGRRKRKEA